MYDSWFTRFGFDQNPYDTRALEKETGVALLYGRETEITNVIDTLKSSTRIPLLIGVNGVGKTSIANVAVYRIIENGRSNQQTFLSLTINAIESSDSSNYTAFRNSVYREILLKMLNEERLLKKCGIDKRQIKAVKHYLTDLYQIGFGTSIFGFGVDLSYNANPIAESNLPRIAHEWLEACFTDTKNGGIICILDNLENIGTASKVRKFLEEARDAYFNIPGLHWILCGTSTALEEALSSSILDGYLLPFEIQPTQIKDVEGLIQHRIAKCKGASEALPPVDSKMFSMLYNEMNMKLRTTLSLCEEFSEHLFHHAQWQSKDRNDEFLKWLDQKSAELPEQEYEVQEDTWKLFDNIAMICDDDIHSSDHMIYNISAEQEFIRQCDILVKKRLLDRIDTDDSPLYRVTNKGWLVHYRRKHTQTNGRSVTGTGEITKISPVIIPKYTLQNGRLSDHDYSIVLSHMQKGGLCILPSDSSYTLTGIPSIPGVTEAIDLLLLRNGEKMSLAFNNIRQAAQMTQLSNMAYHFIDILTPGGLTFVARMSNNGYAKLSARRLYTDGTIAIRITESEVETQLAKEFPLPTTPIRNSDRQVISSFDEAIAIVRDRYSLLPLPRDIVAIEGDVSRSGRLSSVVKEVYQNGFWYIEVRRQGSIDEQTLRNTAIQCQYRDIL